MITYETTYVRQFFSCVMGMFTITSFTGVEKLLQGLVDFHLIVRILLYCLHVMGFDLKFRAEILHELVNFSTRELALGISVWFFVVMAFFVNKLLGLRLELRFDFGCMCLQHLALMATVPTVNTVDLWIRQS